MAIKIVGPIKELTENEDRIGWISPEMDDSINAIFQKKDFERQKYFYGMNTYTPKIIGSYSFAKRWVLDTEDIRSDWFKHE